MIGIFSGNAKATGSAMGFLSVPIQGLRYIALGNGKCALNIVKAK
jgi:hypothetical protein